MRIIAKWVVLMLVLILLSIVFVLSKSITPKKVSPPGSAQNTSTTEIKPIDTTQPEPQQITKCQSVVVGPKSTTELFTYVSGDMIRADYRVAATTEEDSSKTQILYDGELVYMWKPPIFYGGSKPTNPVGQKTRLSDFEYNIDVSALGDVIRFGATPLSGDHLCSEWDGVDPVFEVPSDFTFEESVDINAEISNELTRICQTCDSAGSNEIKMACRRYLVCD